nr:MAG TPA: NTP-PPase-like protein [Caudoviricetes sp.]
MEMNSYQREAARTINKGLSRSEVEAHALYGLAGELGELQSLYQKTYQGHEFDEAHVIKELGDILWFIRDQSLRKAVQENIDKLRARYPDGFNADGSLHRRDGDI